jgi:hypothetical protein
MLLIIFFKMLSTFLGFLGFLGAAAVFAGASLHFAALVSLKNTS